MNIIMVEGKVKIPKRHIKTGLQYKVYYDGVQLTQVVDFSITVPTNHDYYFNCLNLFVSAKHYLTEELNVVDHVCHRLLTGSKILIRGYLNVSSFEEKGSMRYITQAIIRKMEDITFSDSCAPIDINKVTKDKSVIYRSELSKKAYLDEQYLIKKQSEGY